MKFKQVQETRIQVKKHHIFDLPGVYAISTVHMNGRPFLVFASENKGEGAYIFDPISSKTAPLWKGDSGVMNIVQIPGTENLLAITKFYPVFKSKETQICLLTRTGENPMQRWEITPVLDLPFCHRIGVFVSNDDGQPHLVACTLCKDKESEDDWSQPGAVYFGNIPSRGEKWELVKVLDGLKKNHGLWVTGNSQVYVASENGVFKFDCQFYEDGETCIPRRLSATPTSDICVFDTMDAPAFMVSAEPFHGDKVCLYDPGMKKIKEWKESFCHVVWCGNLRARNAMIVGNRGGEKELKIKYLDNWQEVIVDKGIGPTQISLLRADGRDVIISANHGAGSVDAYELIEKSAKGRTRGLTIKKIADMAGVSQGTVDRVLHHRGGVSRDNKRTIERIICQYNFKPNPYARVLKANDTCTVGYLTPLLESEDGYWELVHQGVEKAVQDLAELPFRVQTFEYDRFTPGSFSIAASKMVNSGVQACVIVPKPESETLNFLKAYPDLKYIFLDSAVQGASPVSIVGQNSYLGGALASRIMSMLRPAGGNFLTFSFMNSAISRSRRDGFCDSMKKKPNFNVLQYEVNSVSEIPSVLSQAIKEAGGKLEGVFSPCFAGHYFGDLKKTVQGFEDASIITYDLIPLNRKSLEEGLVDCVLSQRPVFQGYAAVYLLFRNIVLKKDITSSVEVQTDIVFPENLPENYDEQEATKLNQYCIPVR